MYRSFHEGRSAVETALFALNFFGIVVVGAGILTHSIPAAVIGTVMGGIGTGFFLLQAMFEED